MKCRERSKFLFSNSDFINERNITNGNESNYIVGNRISGIAMYPGFSELT